MKRGSYLKTWGKILAPSSIGYSIGNRCERKRTKKDKERKKEKKKPESKISFVEAKILGNTVSPLFRCAVASLYEVVSVRRSVRRFVGPSRVIFEGEK